MAEFTIAVCFLQVVMVYCATKIMSIKVETKTRELCEVIIEHIQTGGIKQRIDTFLADAAHNLGRCRRINR